MEQVTLSPVSTTMAKVCIERAAKRHAEGFLSVAMRDAYADYLQIPYGDLRRALDLHCEQEKLAPSLRGAVLPVMLGQVMTRHLNHARSLSPALAELVSLVERLQELRKAIKSALIR